MVKFASPSCVRFISLGFLLATTCVWVWMVCFLHSVTTGSRDRANVPLIIIIIIICVTTAVCVCRTMYVWPPQPGKVANPARGQQLNRENGLFAVLVRA